MARRASGGYSHRQKLLVQSSPRASAAFSSSAPRACAPGSAISRPSRSRSVPNRSREWLSRAASRRDVSARIAAASPCITASHAGGCGPSVRSVMATSSSKGNRCTGGVGAPVPPMARGRGVGGPRTVLVPALSEHRRFSLMARSRCGRLVCPTQRHRLRCRRCRVLSSHIAPHGRRGYLASPAARQRIGAGVRAVLVRCSPASFRVPGVLTPWTGCRGWGSTPRSWPCSPSSPPSPVTR